MKEGLDWILLGIAAVLMLHAAHGANHFQAYLNANQEDSYVPIPIDIVVEVLIALVLGVISIVGLNSSFADIRMTEKFKKETWETICPQPSFRVHSGTRGALFESM
eukprot:m.62792 g.62792  ORF g.62792 m.62792 type:complete len:106 (+) comp8042_c0_seq1:59-376(+)